jgi:hypothetical protein
MRMQNTVTSMDNITLVQPSTALCTIILNKSAIQQERPTIPLYQNFVQVNPMLKSTTNLNIVSSLTHTISIKSFIVKILMVFSNQLLPIPLIRKNKMILDLEL